MKRGEAFRGGVHFFAGALSAMMCGYNAMRFAEGRERRHAINAAVYFGATIYEAWHTYEHWSDAD